MTPPAVSVLMTVHNGLPYLESALRSVMDQTLRKIEIVVVDDASTDDTPAVLARLAAEDTRIRIVTLDGNHGVGAASNIGLAECRALYVARMDADDLCHPRRLEVQKAYMDAHPHVVLSGTSIRNIDTAGQPIRTRVFPRPPAAARWLARFHYPLTHPSTIFRRTLPSGAAAQYDGDLRRRSEDFDFCTRMLAEGEIAQLPDVLVDYRIHTGSLTSTKNFKESRGFDLGLANQARDLPAAIADSLRPFMEAHYRYTPTSAAQRAAITGAFQRMIAHDSAQTPGLRTWFIRQGAALLYSTFRRGGTGHGAIMGTFLKTAPEFATGRVMRLAEVRNLLPAALRADPIVWEHTPAPSQTARERLA